MPPTPSPHRIRLRGPWTRHVEGTDHVETVTLPEPRREETPDAPPVAAATTVLYRRQFNCPTGLNAETRVFLVLGDCQQVVSAELNGRLLHLIASGSNIRRAVLQRLDRGANTVELRLRAQAEEDCRMSGEAWLEIVEPQ